MNSLSHCAGSFCRLMFAKFPKTPLRKYKWQIYIFLDVSSLNYSYFDANLINFQVSQFAVSLIHSAQVLFLKNCDVPSGVAWFEVASLLTIVFIYYIFVIIPKQRQTSYAKTMVLPATHKPLAPVKLPTIN